MFDAATQKYWPIAAYLSDKLKRICFLIEAQLILGFIAIQGVALSTTACLLLCIQNVPLLAWWFALAQVTAPFTTNASPDSDDNGPGNLASAASAAIVSVGVGVAAAVVEHFGRSDHPRDQSLVEEANGAEQRTAGPLVPESTTSKKKKRRMPPKRKTPAVPSRIK